MQMEVVVRLEEISFVARLTSMIKFVPTFLTFEQYFQISSGAKEF